MLMISVSTTSHDTSLRLAVVTEADTDIEMKM